MVLEVATVTIIILAYCAGYGASVLRVFLLLSSLVLSHLLLILLLNLKLLLLLSEVNPGVLIQIKVKCLKPIEALVSFRDRSLFTLDLLNLVKVLLQMLAGTLGSIPALSFVDNRSDSFVLDNCVYIDGVVHATENTILVRVAHIEVVKKLEPERLKLVRIVLEKIKVVAHC